MKKRFAIFVMLVFSLTATLLGLASCDFAKDKAIDLSGDDIEISFNGKTEFEYKGFELRPDLWILDGYDILDEYHDGVPNDNIVVDYENNIEIGTATVTVTPGESGKYTGKAVAYFEIVASSKKAEAADFDSLKEYLSGGRYPVVAATADITIPEGETVGTEDGVILDMGGYALTNNGTFVNNGDINFSEHGENNLFSNGGTFTNNGKLLLYVTDENETVFINDGELTNTGEIYFNGKEDNRLAAENRGSFNNDGYLYINPHTDFYNYGSFENGGNISTSEKSKFLTDSDVNGNLIEHMSRRYPIEEFGITLSYDKVGYSGQEMRPAPEFHKEGCEVDYDDYDIFYENNVNTGTATVRIVATKDSDAFYGETTLYFEIEKGSVTVSDRESFYSVIVNPNYNIIRLSITDQVGTLLNEGFTVPEGLSLIIISDSDEGMRGNVVNNGEIVVSGVYGLRVYGMLENNGKIYTNYIVNKGSIENNGTISLGTGTSYSGNLNNSGSIYLCEEGSLYAGSDVSEVKEFVNDGSVTSLGTVYVNNTLINNGTFENIGELYVFSTGKVTANELIENSGNVYLNEESDAFGGTGSVTVKSAIQSSDVEITNLPFVYNGREKEATVRIAGGISDKYDIAYLKGITEIDYPINAGDYKLTVTFREDSKIFKGSATVEFSVGRAETTVNTYDALIAALDNYNYYRVIYDRSYINGDLEVPQGYVLVIPEYQTLVNNGYEIEVNGSVENNGVYANATIASVLTVNDGANFVNNGISYFNDSVPAGVSGEGDVYVREDIAGATVLTLTKTQVVYRNENGYIRTEIPGFTLTTLEGDTVDEGNYSSFCTNYYDISTEGDLAKLIVRASSTSTKYYGEISAEYTVLPGEAEAATFEELKEALGNIKEGTELCNFGRITLTADIDVEGNRTEQTLVVPENVTLVLGDYALDLRPEGTFDKNVFLENNGIIEMTSHNIDCSGSTGSGKYVGYASTASVLSSLTGLDEVYLTADITEEVTLYAYTSSTSTCVIDMCGYDIRRITVVMQGRRNFIIKSSVQGSVIGGDQYAESGIYCQEIDEKATLTLVNLTVYGIEYNYLAEENRVVIDESCSVIN